jgi:hypothetical protein
MTRTLSVVVLRSTPQAFPFFLLATLMMGLSMPLQAQVFSVDSSGNTSATTYQANGGAAGMVSLTGASTLPSVPSGTFSIAAPTSAIGTSFVWMAPTSANTGAAGLLNVGLASGTPKVSQLSFSAFTDASGIGAYTGTQFQVPVGSSTAPSLFFSGTTTSGLYFENTGAGVGFAVGSSSIAGVFGNGVREIDTGVFAWVPGTTLSAAVDTGLSRDSTYGSGYVDVGTGANNNASGSIVAQGFVFAFPNNGTTGTVINELAILTGTPSSSATVALTGSTTGVICVVTANAGTSGSAAILFAGIATCSFDGAATAGHYVQASSTAGKCHDAGAGRPGSNQVLGRVTANLASPGNTTVLFQVTQ